MAIWRVQMPMFVFPRSAAVVREVETIRGIQQDVGELRHRVDDLFFGGGKR